MTACRTLCGTLCPRVGLLLFQALSLRARRAVTWDTAILHAAGYYIKRLRYVKIVRLKRDEQRRAVVTLRWLILFSLVLRAVYSFHAALHHYIIAQYKHQTLLRTLPYLYSDASFTLWRTTARRDYPVVKDASLRLRITSPTPLPYTLTYAPARYAGHNMPRRIGGPLFSRLFCAAFWSRALCQHRLPPPRLAILLAWRFMTYTV